MVCRLTLIEGFKVNLTKFGYMTLDRGGTMVSAVTPHQKGPGFEPVQSLDVHKVPGWGSSGCAGFLPHSKDI